MTATLILGPRPGKKSKDQIKALGVTHMVSLLGIREQASSIDRIANAIGASWYHFPVNGGHLDTLQTLDVAQLFLLYDTINRGSDAPIIYLHCSAGIHRTGFVAYLLLRYRGLSPQQARTEMGEMRAVTLEQVGEDRIALAESKFIAWQAA
ncbi:MAG: tyrosine-protein phosphatase [Pseudomonadota bacterium]